MDLVAVIVLASLTFIWGVILVVSAKKFKVDGNPMVDKVNAILPQTQCGQCNYPGCKPYAEAIVSSEAQINQCPPGGQEGVDALADLLGVETLPLNEENGIEKPKQVAIIIEEDCIGCTLCIQACPVDAIVGASKVMTIVIGDECTGCELCVEPCPVNCIIMIDTKVNPIPAMKV